MKKITYKVQKEYNPIINDHIFHGIAIERETGVHLASVYGETLSHTAQKLISATCKHNLYINTFTGQSKCMNCKLTK